MNNTAFSLSSRRPPDRNVIVPAVRGPESWTSGANGGSQIHRGWWSVGRLMNWSKRTAAPRAVLRRLALSALPVATRASPKDHGCATRASRQLVLGRLAYSQSRWRRRLSPGWSLQVRSSRTSPRGDARSAGDRDPAAGRGNPAQVLATCQPSPGGRSRAGHLAGWMNGFSAWDMVGQAGLEAAYGQPESSQAGTQGVFSQRMDGESPAP